MNKFYLKNLQSQWLLLSHQRCRHVLLQLSALLTLLVLLPQAGFGQAESKEGFENFTAASTTQCAYDAVNNYAACMEFDGWNYGTNFTEIGAAVYYSAASPVRSGQRALFVDPTSTTAYNEWHNATKKITVPADGKHYYVHIIAFTRREVEGPTRLNSDGTTYTTVAGSPEISVGVKAGSTATDYNATATTPPDASFAMITHRIGTTTTPAAPGEYYPAFRIKEAVAGNARVYVDDVHIFYSESPTLDLTAPTPASDLSYTLAGSTLTVNFTNGTDTESGLAGYLILKYTGGIGSGTPTVQNQVEYHPTDNTKGPQTIQLYSPFETWSVYSNGTSTSGSFIDDVTVSTTYLVYMRDKMGNYSAPKRIAFVNAGTATNANVTFDMLLLNIPSSGQLQFGTGYTCTLPSGAIIAGTGTITNNGTLALPGSSYSFGGITLDNSQNGKIVVGTGTTITFPKALRLIHDSGSITIENGGKIVIPSGATIHHKLGSLTIRNGGEVTLSGTYLADQGTATTLTVEGGGRLNINAGATYNLTAGTLTVATNGIVNVSGTLVEGVNAIIASPSDALLTFNNGSLFDYQKAGGNLPMATWATGSTCKITGSPYYTGAVPGNLNQSFGNFTWNVPTQGPTLNASTLTDVRGTFKVENTKNAILVLGSTGTAHTYGRLEITGGKVHGNNTGGAMPVFTIKDEFKITDGEFIATTNSSGRPVLNIEKDITIAGGSFASIQNTVTLTTPVATINFTGSSYNTQLAWPTLNKDNTGLWNFNVKAGRSVTLANHLKLGNRCTFTVEAGGSLVAHNLFVEPIKDATTDATNTSFILNSGGTLSLGDANGIVLASDASPARGNIRTATRTFNTGANYIYNGVVAQATGNALPATVNSLTLFNASGLTLTNPDVMINNELSLINGTWNIKGKKVTINNKISFTSGLGKLDGDAATEIVVDGLANPQTTLPEIGDIGILRLNRTAGLKLSSDLKAYNLVELQAGKLETQSHTLTLWTDVTAARTSTFSTMSAPTEATLSETNTSFVLGTVKTTHNVAATGTAYNFSGIGANVTFQNRAGGMTTVTRTTGNHESLTDIYGATGIVSIKRFYDITPTGAPDFNATVKLKYSPEDFPHLTSAGISTSTLFIYRYLASKGGWQETTKTTADPATHTLTVASVNEFGRMTVAPPKGTFPVELVRFNANEHKGHVILNWNTASETNNLGFDIERSEDGVANWARIGHVAGAGTTSLPQQYGFTDYQPFRNATQIYYRLLQKDHDGTTTNSKVVSVAAKERTFGVEYATVQSNHLSLGVSASKYQNVNVRLLDLNGKQYHSASFEATGNGITEKSWNVPNLPATVYVIVVETESEVKTIKAVSGAITQ